MERVHILGIPIDPVTMEEAVRRVQEMLQRSVQCHVMTPNSEMLVEAHRNPAFKEVLQKSMLNLPDSAGLLWAARRQGQRLPERVSGVDFVERLCATLSADVPVFLLGGRNGVAEKAAQKLRMDPTSLKLRGAGNGELRIIGMYEGSPQEEDAQEIIHRVNISAAKLLLVAYGAPVQDLWIAKHLSGMPNIRVAIGVGGTFDFLAGNIRRAPKWMRSLGLEWLWRLMLQPQRIGRICMAIIVFPFLVLTTKKHAS
ncbi:MAG: N-acetylglucosaminyldiphosphoundecaprenol [Candidatus Peregrinibacteria bacterium Greene0416_62]|nr:MAG: N-acetylglucosaminyldiphosphoundecaprenol [Candidatus Peregrinibacteria bacterium Greene0416_62]TSC97143.1 MAG: N-acetylglucosaminyldiphosphoundecaprenol [Candidatus Peregrinibacteria bacterium Greene1014_49]